MGLGSVAAAKAAYRLFSTGAITHEAVTAPHHRLCRSEAARHPVVLMVHDDTILDFSGHAALSGAGRIGTGHGTGCLAHSCLAVLPSGESLGLAHQTIGARPASGRSEAPSESGVWADTVRAIGLAPDGTRFVSVGDRGSDLFAHLVAARDLGWEVLLRGYHDRRTAEGDRSIRTLRRAKARAAATVVTRDGAVAVCLAWRTLDLLAPGGEGSLRISGVRVWGNGLEWILLTTCPVMGAEDAIRIAEWYAIRWTVEEFHKAWKTGCRAEARRLATADRLMPLLGALSIVAVRLLILRDEARRDGDAPSDAPAAAIRILAAKLGQPAERFASRRGFLRGVAQLGGFLARNSDGDPGWQTIWRGWARLMAMIDGYAIALALAQAKCG